LTPWGPGQSGNPGGRPKKQPITERYAILAETPLDDRLLRTLKLPKGSTYADAAALGQFKAAIEGKTNAVREIREALEGKSTSRVEVIGRITPELSDTDRAAAMAIVAKMKGE